MRGRVCNLLSLLVLSSAVPLGPESHGTQDHILLSKFSRLPQPGEPVPRIYIPQEQGGPDIPPGTGFPFRRPLLSAGLRWRYSIPPPHGIHSSAVVTSFYRRYGLYISARLFSGERALNWKNSKDNLVAIPQWFSKNTLRWYGLDGTGTRKLKANPHHFLHCALLSAPPASSLTLAWYRTSKFAAISHERHAQIVNLKSPTP
jgi:hypothetical protein